MKDLTRYANAKPSPTMEAFADFLIREVYGDSLPDGIDETSFRTGVALGGSTRNYFQASDAWKSDPRNYLANVEKNRAAKLAERAERAAESKRKADARLADLEAKLAEAVEAAKAKAEAVSEEETRAVAAAEAASEDAANAVNAVAEDAEDADAAIEVAEDSDAAADAAAERAEGSRRSRRGPLSKTIEDAA